MELNNLRNLLSFSTKCLRSYRLSTYVLKAARRDRELVYDVERDAGDGRAGHDPAHCDGPLWVRVVSTQHLLVGQHRHDEQHQKEYRTVGGEEEISHWFQ